MSTLLAREIKQAALDLGFDLVGVASTNDSALGQAVERYSRWVDSGYAASMDYLKRHAEIKSQPEKFLAGARSVVCVALLYAEPAPPADEKSALVSVYTRGEDYHELIEKKLEELSRLLREKHGIESRAYVDSKPVFDRFWAWRAGLGWLGKNTVLINRKLGSYMFLGGLFVAADLETDTPSADHCGRCRKCIEACPTDAILEDRFIDSDKCIAYHTIENKGAVPESVMERTGRWIAGCDICQQVCPWNDPITPGRSFTFSNPAFNAPLSQIARWSLSDFKELTSGVAMNRMKYPAFLRNVAIAVANSDLSAEEKGAALNEIRVALGELPESSAKAGALEALRWAESK